jgi:hypothetical protein
LLSSAVTEKGHHAMSHDTRPDTEPAGPGKKANAWVRMRTRWGVRSDWAVLAILVSFALAGMSVLKVSRPIMHLVLPPDAPKWLWWTLRVTIIPPVYEVLLLIYGTLLGQGSFFLGKQKRLWLRILRRAPSGEPVRSS